ncbi:hypothetical protein [Micromonospora sp. SL4-19]|uniref:hypothetical protein n=1 Tax=Micromonospora sp. SL4-19 TaxID=3399129 RepID=UPI003A4D7B3D
MLLAVDGLVPGPSDQASDELLQAAEATAREALRDRLVEQLPHVAAWREAYRAFGAKAQRTRNSLEGLGEPQHSRPDSHINRLLVPPLRLVFEREHEPQTHDHHPR